MPGHFPPGQTCKPDAVEVPTRGAFQALLSCPSPRGILPGRRPPARGAGGVPSYGAAEQAVGQSRRLRDGTLDSEAALPTSVHPPAAAQLATASSQAELPRVVDGGAPPRSSWCSLLGALSAPLAYLVLYVVYDILCAKSAQDGGGYYRFEPACMVLIIEFGKLMVTLLFLVVWTPTETPSLYRVGKTAASMTLVAVCFTAINIINLVCLAQVSLASYAVWYQTGILFNAVLWYFMFRAPFNTQKVLALLLLTAGCIVNSIQPGLAFHIDSKIGLVLCSALISALGCVLNEYFVKKDVQLDLNIQNAILYTETCICCLVVVAVLDHTRLTSPAKFLQGFATDCWFIASVSILIGLSVSRILKYSSAITKNFVMALHCPVEVFAAHYIVATPLTVFTFASTVLIGSATFMYYISPAYLVPPAFLKGAVGRLCSPASPRCDETKAQA